MVHQVLPGEHPSRRGTASRQAWAEAGSAQPGWGRGGAGAQGRGALHLPLVCEPACLQSHGRVPSLPPSFSL